MKKLNIPVSAQLPLSAFADAFKPLQLDDLADLRDMMKLDGVPEPLSALILSNGLKPNLYQNFLYISSLAGLGYNNAEIAKVSGLAPAFIGRCLQMGKLHPKIAAAYMAGAIKRTVAESIAKLGQGYQARLAAVLAEHGTLTAKDVHEVRRAGAASAATALPAFMFETPGAASLEQGKVNTDTTPQADYQPFKNLVRKWRRKSGDFGPLVARAYNDAANELEAQLKKTSGRKAEA